MSSRGVSALDVAAAEQIRALAGRLHMSMFQVADAVGIPRSTFKRYWHASRPMTLGDFENTLEVLGSSYLWERVRIRHRRFEHEREGAFNDDEVAV
jgi:transcriptional regulator with XRE-family HTH domain